MTYIRDASRGARHLATIRERDERIRELEANQRLPKRRWKTASEAAQILATAPGANMGPSNRLRRLDARITRCHRCGAWQWDQTCTVDHAAMDENAEAA